MHTGNYILNVNTLIVFSLILPHHPSMYGRRAFPVAGLTVWNLFLDNLQDPDVTIHNFKCLMKTFLFLPHQCN